LNILCLDTEMTKIVLRMATFTKLVLTGLPGGHFFGCQTSNDYWMACESEPDYSLFSDRKP
jgi:hypothetical protein